MTTVGSGGLLLWGIRYGAEAYQLLLRVAAGVTAAGRVTPASALPATAALTPAATVIASSADARCARFMRSPEGHGSHLGPPLAWGTQRTGALTGRHRCAARLAVALRRDRANEENVHQDAMRCQYFGLVQF